MFALVVTATRLRATGHPSTHTAPPTASGPTVATWHLLAAIGVIVLVCRAGGWLARFLNQPPVIGEIVAGVLLGPSVLSAVVPGVLSRLLPPGLRSELGVLANIGIVLFAFGLGLGLDGRHWSTRARAAVWVSHASMAVPFVCGCFLALTLSGPLGPTGAFAPYCLFLGAAMSITALPVLGRILDDTGLKTSSLGQLAIVCAAVDDVTAWIVLSVVVAVARGHGAWPTVRILLLGAVLALMVLGGMRRLLGRLADCPSAALAAGLALVGAAASDWIGLQAIFGAFLVGCAMPRSGALAEHARRLGPLNEAVLLPIFFVTAGLQVDLRGLTHHPGELAAGAAVLAVAIVTKLGAGALAARASGMRRAEAVALGVLMNTRGLTELIVLQVGLQLGVLPRGLYTVLVVVALVTTAMTMPALRRLHHWDPRAVPLAILPGSM